MFYWCNDFSIVLLYIVQVCGLSFNLLQKYLFVLIYDSINYFSGIFDPIVTLTLDLLNPKLKAIILSPKFISVESLVTFRQLTLKISR